MDEQLNKYDLLELKKEFAGRYAEDLEYDTLIEIATELKLKELLKMSQDEFSDEVYYYYDQDPEAFDRLVRYIFPTSPN